MGRCFQYLESRLTSTNEGGLLPLCGVAHTRARLASPIATTSKGSLLDTEEIRVATNHCEVDTDHFGRISIRSSELPRLHPLNGLCIGSIVSFELLAIADSDRFRHAADARFRHELMWEVHAGNYDHILQQMPFYQEVLERHCVALS